MICKKCDACKKGYFKSQPDAYVCTGVKNPFVIKNINSQCSEYKRTDVVKKQEKITRLSVALDVIKMEDPLFFAFVEKYHGSHLTTEIIIDYANFLNKKK